LKNTWQVYEEYCLFGEVQEGPETLQAPRDHGDRSLICSPKIRTEKRKSVSAASVSFCIQRKIANYLEESKELLTFAAETFQIIEL
jgi:hypothetical protein